VASELNTVTIGHAFDPAGVARTPPSLELVTAACDRETDTSDRETDDGDTGTNECDGEADVCDRQTDACRWETDVRGWEIYHPDAETDACESEVYESGDAAAQSNGTTIDHELRAAAGDTTTCDSNTTTSCSDTTTASSNVAAAAGKLLGVDADTRTDDLHRRGVTHNRPTAGLKVLPVDGEVVPFNPDLVTAAGGVPPVSSHFVPADHNVVPADGETVPFGVTFVSVYHAVVATTDIVPGRPEVTAGGRRLPATNQDSRRFHHPSLRSG
jgi:hypothetical protein